MKIVIPTYQRYQPLTLNHLKDLFDNVYLFVANKEEYSMYRYKYPSANIIVGKKGIKNQRNFITNYFDEGEIIVSMDDDIEEFSDRKNRPISEWLKDCCDELEKSDCGLMTFPPTYNHWFAKDNPSYQEGIYGAIGVFHIYKNHKELQLSVDQVEDYERSVLYIKKYDKNLRCWDIHYKHSGWECWSSKKRLPGGLDDQRTLLTYTKARNTALWKYSEYLRAHQKKSSPVTSIQLRRQPIEQKIVLLPFTDLFLDLFPMLESVKTKLRYYRDDKHRKGSKSVGNRRGFPSYRGGVFGKVRKRLTGEYGEASMNSQFPVIYEEIVRIGKIVCPFDFDAIQLNRNLQCPPHIDGKNVGDSMLVSFGDYDGGEIVIDGEAFDARENPLVFNGAKYEHWNNPIFSGTKYSLVYFSNQEKK